MKATDSPKRRMILYVSRGIFNLGAVPTETARLILQGVEDACQELDLTLVSLTLNDFTKLPYRSYYDLAPQMGADGALVWISSLSPSLPPYLEAFAPTPLVGIGLPDACPQPKVDIDNRTGMLELMDHLIVHHGLTRFAVIRGPSHHPYAQERFAAYREALATHGLAFDPRKTFESTNWFSQEAADAVHYFFEDCGFQAGRDIEAIVCANDRGAHVALNALKARGLRVPQDLVVCGFNNQLEAQVAIPSLSSVTVPLGHQAFHAVTLLRQAIEGQAIPAQTRITSHVAIHESCGCPNEHLTFAPQTRDQAHARLGQRFAQAVPPVPGSWAPRLLDQWDQALTTRDLTGILALFHEVMLDHSHLGNSMFWQDCLSDLASFASVPDLLHPMRVLVNDYANRTSAPVNTSNPIEMESILKLETLLMQCTDGPTVQTVLRDALPSLSVTACHLFLFPEAVEQSQDLPAEVVHTFAFRQGETEASPVLTGRLGWKDLLPALGRQSPETRHFNVWPVMASHHSFGLMVFGLGHIAVQSLESIVGRVSTVLSSIRILDALRAKSADLEQSIVRLETTRHALFESEKMAALGRLVAGLAHEVNTPLGVAVTAASLTELTCRQILQRLSGPAPYKDELTGLAEDAIVSAGLATKNLRRAVDLVDDFKKVSVDAHREEPSSVQVVDFLENVVHSLSQRFQEGGHTAKVTGPRDLRIRTYPMAIAQVFTNLIMNSLIHGFDHRKGGTIEIEVAPTNRGTSVVYRDNGRGMDELTISRMYEPFFTTRRAHGGTGLGLSIVHGLVEQRLGGTIECQSRPGEGVRFTVTVSEAPAPIGDLPSLI